MSTQSVPKGAPQCPIQSRCFSPQMPLQVRSETCPAPAHLMSLGRACFPDVRLHLQDRKENFRRNQ